MIYFTSDTHFGHANIIKHCHRPFSSVGEMDDAIIANWNKKVGPKDIVYHLGDFALVKSAGDLYKYVGRLNGHINLICGNHDKLGLVRSANFRSVHSGFISITPEFGVNIVLCHYAMRTWYKSHYGYYHLYGHSHGNLPEDGSLSFDVGVDCNDFTPLSLNKVIDRLNSKNSRVYKVNE